jgi:hypothetical protein
MDMLCVSVCVCACACVFTCVYLYVYRRPGPGDGDLPASQPNARTALCPDHGSKAHTHVSTHTLSLPCPLTLGTGGHAGGSAQAGTPPAHRQDQSGVCRGGTLTSLRGRKEEAGEEYARRNHLLAHIFHAI